MNRIFTAAIAVAAIAFAGANPAKAATFPSLTLIYVASGAMDNGLGIDANIASAVSCTNRSGQTASVRFQFRHSTGAPLAGGTLLVASLATKTVTTEGGVQFLNETSLPTGSFLGGSLEILSTQSAVFCSAWLVGAAGTLSVSGVPLHMARFNPHPGTVE